MAVAKKMIALIHRWCDDWTLVAVFDSQFDATAFAEEIEKAAGGDFTGYWHYEQVGVNHTSDDAAKVADWMDF